MKRPGFLPVRGAKRDAADFLHKLLPIGLPVVLAISMALMFRHPAMLMFGLMGPLLALTGSWNKKRTQDKQASENQEREREREHHHQLEQQRLANAWQHQQILAHPAVTDWLHNPLWRPEANTADAEVRVGLGTVTPPAGSGIHQPVAGIPLTIPLHASLAVVGSGLDAVAAWRAVACQAIAIASAPGGAAAAHLPVPGIWAKNADIPGTVNIPHPSGDHSTTWCFVDSATQVPPQATWVLVVEGATRAQLFHRGVLVSDGLHPDVLTFAQSRWVRARLVDTQTESAPSTHAMSADDRGSLWAELAPDQPALNLVAQGPHTLVWGKTGSGKSVLVQKLVSSLCARYSPDQFALVGIDFKGGATLAPLMAHPHGAGLLTDLTPAAIARVTASLRAEILRREQLFADCRVATWQDLPGDTVCPRVLIVVDEAGVVAHDAPELMEVLSDIASRGRSLGLHLLVSTQRPQHLPRNIIANCALRLCMGVTDADEASHYTPDIPRHLLHSLRHSPPGAVLLPDTPGSYTLGIVDPSPPDVSWPGFTQRSLWCEELPGHLTAEDVSDTSEGFDDGYLLGLADHPDQQLQAPWFYRPGQHGPLVVVGESCSGHTTGLTHLASVAEKQQVEVVWGSEVASVVAWQLMTLRGTSTTATPTLFVVDRLDRILRGVPPDSQAWIVDALEALAAELSERGDGSGAVVTAAPGNSVASALARWNATKVLFRHRDPTQWALAGGVQALHDPTSPPGRAVVDRVAMQWCHPGTTTRGALTDVVLEGAPEGCLVITSQPGQNPQAEVIGLGEAETRWQDIKQATTHGVGAVCSDIPPQLMRQWCGPGHTTPPVVAAWPYGWLLHPGGVRLVTLAT